MGPPAIANARRCPNISGCRSRIAAATTSLARYSDFSGAWIHACPAWNSTFTTSSAAATRRHRGESTNVQQYAAAGLNFGYYYDDSPLIAYDGAPHPPYSMGAFEPSTVPGCWTPHVWLADGRSLYDVHGDGYALLRLDPSLDPTPLLGAAAERGVPLRLIDLDPAEAGAVYTTRLLLSRPDRHVAWRGDALPEDVAGLVGRVRGEG